MAAPESSRRDDSIDEGGGTGTTIAIADETTPLLTSTAQPHSNGLADATTASNGEVTVLAQEISTASACRCAR